MSLPESHVVAEGRTLLAAREIAATQLGVPVNAVEHKLDLAHFKASGTSGATTVKIFAWAKDVTHIAPSLAAEGWMKGLLSAMGREALVRAEMNGDTAVVFVDAGESARHLVGRQGTTLRAIEHLLGRTLADSFPGVQCRIDVARPDGDRPREDRPPRDDRGPRNDDRGPRNFGGDDRGPRRDDRPRRNDGEALRSLARKLAEKVAETGEVEVIRRELNSFDRRLVHLEVAEIAGVASRSVGEGAERRVEIYVPTPGAAAQE